MTGTRRTGRPTIDEVAAKAGVGRGTVSRVLNGSSLVRPHTAELVRRVIDELGYVPSRAARSLVTRRTDAIALVVSESEERVFGEPFFAQIIRGISAALADTPYQLWLAMAQSPADQVRLAGHLDPQHVDGALLLSLHGTDTLPALLAERELPAVSAGGPSGPSPTDAPAAGGAGGGGGGISVVDADNRGGARRAVEHLLAAGRRRIATITGPQDMRVGQARLAGWQDAYADAGLPAPPDLVEIGDFRVEGGRRAALALLDRRPDLDAIFAASDPMAFGALQALREQGRAVPADVAVVGFDDSDSARHSVPTLTSVHQPTDAMGREMVRLLLARIAGEPDIPAEVLLPTHLVLRASG